jgi:hypothetical protein
MDGGRTVAGYIKRQLQLDQEFAMHSRYARQFLDHCALFGHSSEVA